MRFRRGFTLIEMAVVIGILGVLAVFAVPQLRTFNEGWTLDRFGDSVFNSIRSLGSRVRATDREFRVNVDLDGDAMTFEQCRCDGGSGTWNRSEGVPAVRASEDVIFYAAGESGDVDRSGTKQFRLTIDRSTDFLLHLTTDPAPEEANRCSFRTVRIRSPNLRVEQFDYGRGDPFPDDEPPCAS